MKKIAVITAGLLPIPAIKGGAIETLLQYAIDYNEDEKDFLYDIYSIYDVNAEEVAEKYKNANFKYINVNNFLNRIYYNLCRIIRKLGFKDPNFQLPYIAKVCKNLKENNYDLILIESDNHFVLPVKKSTNTPIILYLHNDKLNSDTKEANKILNACSHILTVSDYIKSRVLTVDNQKYDKVTTILNGIDTTMFQLEDRQTIRKQLREKYHIGENDFVFLFTGRIEPNKGVLELVQAFNKIESNRARLMILGGSFFSSNKKTKYVRNVEDVIGNNKRVITLGYIAYKEIPKYHILSDCMVSPSMWEEPGSLVNQEAFASGLPLISSYSGGTPEYTKNTKSILIKKDDNFIQNLSKEMENLIENGNLQKEMKEAGIKESKYFSKGRYCKDFAKFLKGEGQI